MELPGNFDHPALYTAIGTVVTYGLVLLVMTLLLFGLPFLFFSVFGP